MRNLAIFEIILISLCLATGGFFLWQYQTPESDNLQERAVKSGGLDISYLLVWDKYESGGRQGQCFITFSGVETKKKISRNVSRRMYKNIHIGDSYPAYNYGGDYIIPGLDVNSDVMRWNRYLALVCWLLAISLFIFNLRVYKAGKAKDFARMLANSDMQKD